MNKSVIFIGMAIGSYLGGYLPTLFGAGVFSLTSIFCSGIGGIAGIWLSYKIVNY